MAKAHRRFIRVNGKMKKSPPFKNAVDANTWYQDRLREKQHLQQGMSLPLDSKTTLKTYFHGKWLVDRKKNYTKATWGSDEQRFRDYVEKTLGNLRIARINQLQVRNCIHAVTQKYEMSIQTRNKVRSLLSKIFGDAMLEDPPLRVDNPGLGLRFKDPRMGKKKPKHISNPKDIQKYLKVARAHGKMVFAIVCTFLMAALRKSELIALTWSCFDEENNQLIIRARYVQAEKKIMKGTKAGREEERIVPIPDALVDFLQAWRKQSDFQGEEDFIFSNEKGECLYPRVINTMLDLIRTESGVENGNPHALRHSFGRWFVANGGNLKALQTIMGHSNYKTTEQYSELVAEQVKKERNRVSFEVEE